jgi:cellobiose phosphorylase
MPPVGVVGWTWYEIINLCSHHVAGVRPDIDALTVQPRLPDRIERLTSVHGVRGARVHLSVHRGSGKGSATVNGKDVPVEQGAVRIPYPRRGSTLTLEFTL